MREGMSRAVSTQTVALGVLDVILEQNHMLAVVLELFGRMDKNVEKFLAQLSEN